MSKTPFDEWLEKNNGNDLASSDNVSDEVVRPWDFFDPSVARASDEKAAARYEICKACPELIRMTKQCKKCGCFMAAKTKIDIATCPLQKW